MRWKCNTTFEIRILSQSSQVLNKVKAFDHVFQDPHSWWGEDAMIDYQELQSGYIKPDGSIDIRVFLKVNNLRRY